MNHKQEIIQIEERIKSLMDERAILLHTDRALTSTEVDRIFDIAAEIDKQFEYQSMLLPLIEDPKTQDRWDTPFGGEFRKHLASVQSNYLSP